MLLISSLNFWLLSFLKKNLKKFSNAMLPERINTKETFSFFCFLKEKTCFDVFKKIREVTVIMEKGKIKIQ